MVWKVLCNAVLFFSFLSKSLFGHDMVVRTNTNGLKAWAALFLIPALMQIYELGGT